jgi:hypothetical protein
MKKTKLTEKQYIAIQILRQAEFHVKCLMSKDLSITEEDKVRLINNKMMELTSNKSMTVHKPTEYDLKVLANIKHTPKTGKRKRSTPVALRKH